MELLLRGFGQKPRLYKHAYFEAPGVSQTFVSFSFSFRQEREANFAQKKAERATVRSHFRDKYRLPKVSRGSWSPGRGSVSVQRRVHY